MPEDIETFRDHFLSIYQSAVSEIAKRIDQHELETPIRRRSPSTRSAVSVLPGLAAEIARREYMRSRGVTSVPTRPARRALTAADATRACAELAFRYLKANVSGDAAALAQIQGEFRASSCDPAWAS